MTRPRPLFIALLALWAFLLSPKPFLHAMPKVERVVLADHALELDTLLDQDAMALVERLGDSRPRRQTGDRRGEPY